jgi:hypothetical protein
MQDVSVIDADGHVQESDAELEQYFDGPYKGHRRSGVFSIFPSLDGWPRGFVRGLDQVNRATAGVWIEFISKARRSMPQYSHGTFLAAFYRPVTSCR